MARPSPPRSVIGLSGRIAAFIGASVLAGALVAGLALPVLGGLGLTAKAASENFDDLPADLAQPAMSQPSYIYDAAGNQIAMTYSRYRIIVGHDDIAPIMRQALVSIEDSRFYQHGPIDLKGTLRALLHNQQNSGQSTQGGSSLTQQYVKNIFIEQAGNDPQKLAQATEQTVSRKIKELKYAIGVEQRLTKEQILTNYLNITFFGQQAYGVEAASRRYFSKHAKDLTLPEAALLAGTVQAPSQYDPITAPRTATERRNVVLQRMADTHAISQQQADQAKATPLGLKVSPLQNGCVNAGSSAFFCDYVEHVVKTDPMFGKTQAARDALWHSGGLKIVTTLQPQAQAAAQKAIDDRVYQKDKFASAVSEVQPGTGKIVAMAQSRPYGFTDPQTVINLNVDQSMGGSTYGFQTGSTFKAFTAAAFLDGGGSVGQSFTTGSQLDMRKEKFSTCGKPVRDPGWQPKNESSSEAGTFDMQTAMEKSVNSYFVLLSQQEGLCPIATMASQMGVHQGNGQALQQVPSLTLGINEVAPLTMATAYATFANRGSYCTPVAIASITRLDGSQLPVPKTTCKQVMKPQTADTVNALLTGVMSDGTGRSAKLDDRPSAGKTGTTDSKYAAWFVGYTPQLAAAVWVGSPKGHVSMVDVSIGGHHFASLQGAELPAPLWKAAVSGSLKGVKGTGFTPPPSGAIPTAPDQKAKGDDHSGTRRDNDGNQATMPKPPNTAPKPPTTGTTPTGPPGRRQPGHPGKPGHGGLTGGDSPISGPGSGGSGIFDPIGIDPIPRPPTDAGPTQPPGGQSTGGGTSQGGGGTTPTTDSSHPSGG